jgi:hypothetical protein
LKRKECPNGTNYQLLKEGVESHVVKSVGGLKKTTRDVLYGHHQDLCVNLSPVNYTFVSLVKTSIVRVCGRRCNTTSTLAPPPVKKKGKAIPVPGHGGP